MLLLDAITVEQRCVRYAGRIALRASTGWARLALVLDADGPPAPGRVRFRGGALDSAPCSGVVRVPSDVADAADWTRQAVVAFTRAALERLDRAPATPERSAEAPIGPVHYDLRHATVYELPDIRDGPAPEAWPPIVGAPAELHIWSRIPVEIGKWVFKMAHELATSTDARPMATVAQLRECRLDARKLSGALGLIDGGLWQDRAKAFVRLVWPAKAHDDRTILRDFARFLPLEEAALWLLVLACDPETLPRWSALSSEARAAVTIWINGFGAGHSLHPRLPALLQAFKPADATSDGARTVRRRLDDFGPELSTAEGWRGSFARFTLSPMIGLTLDGGHAVYPLAGGAPGDATYHAINLAAFSSLHVEEPRADLGAWVDAHWYA